MLFLAARNHPEFFMNSVEASTHATYGLIVKLHFATFYFLNISLAKPVWLLLRG